MIQHSSGAGGRLAARCGAGFSLSSGGGLSRGAEWGLWAALVCAVLFLLSAVVQPAAAQGEGGAGNGDRPGCTRQPHAAATPPARGPASGTAPGNAGSTGWTGGTGGTYTGTTPQAPTPGSPTAHPETVRGLDPKPDDARRPC